MVTNLVTVEEYEEFLVTHPKHTVPQCWAMQKECPQNPVVYVSAEDAEAYARFTKQRLITEEEWKLGWKKWNGFPLYEWTIGNDSAYILRGGSWYGFAGIARASYRYFYWPGDRNFYAGFRVAAIGRKAK